MVVIPSRRLHTLLEVDSVCTLEKTLENSKIFSLLKLTEDESYGTKNAWVAILYMSMRPMSDSSESQRIKVGPRRRQDLLLQEIYAGALLS